MYTNDGQLTLIAALLYNLALSALVSCCASRSSPVAAIVAAEESAGRGAGTSGALKSLFRQNYESGCKKRRLWLPTKERHRPQEGLSKSTPPNDERSEDKHCSRYDNTLVHGHGTYGYAQVRAIEAGWHTVGKTIYCPGLTARPSAWLDVSIIGTRE